MSSTHPLLTQNTTENKEFENLVAREAREMEVKFRGMGKATQGSQGRGRVRNIPISEALSSKGVIN